MLKIFLNIVFLFVITFSGFSSFAACLKEGDKVSLTGIVSERLYYGPPGWGEDKEHDEKLHEWILHLKQPLTCVIDANTDSLDWNKDVQLIMRDNNDYKVNENFLGKMVSVNGVIFLAETGYHMTPVLLDDVIFTIVDE